MPHPWIQKYTPIKKSKANKIIAGKTTDYTILNGSYFTSNDDINTVLLSSKAVKFNK